MAKLDHTKLYIILYYFTFRIGKLITIEIIYNYNEYE